MDKTHVVEHIMKVNENRVKAASSNATSLISIIICNKNGERYLARLFHKFNENLLYPNYEIVVFDNNSSDSSINLLRSLSERLPIRIIQNNTNFNFSESNNRAAAQAKGDYLVLLNNDVEPTKGWLLEMLRCMENHRNVGAVGAKLVYPLLERRNKNKKIELKIQHAGIAFKYERRYIRPYNIGKGLDPYNPYVDVECERAAVTGAVLLVNRDLFLQVGGLDERYVYGYEDVDFCMKLFAKGYRNWYCPTSLLFHYEGGTQQKEHRKSVMERIVRNRVLLNKSWSNLINEHIKQELMDGRNLFVEKKMEPHLYKKVIIGRTSGM